jgi:NADH dehydrogenase
VKVFVTGATGFVGREVLRQLQDASQAIRILARNPASTTAREAAARYAVEVTVGNVLKPETLDGAMTECDAIIHLVGILSEVGDQTFENVHPRATQNVVAAAKRAGVGRFIHMSALGTRPNAVARYHQTKWAAEETVRRSGLDWTIFRH